MKGHPDMVTAIHHDLLGRQLTRIRDRHPHLFEGQQPRLASYLERGQINMRSVLHSAGVSDDAIAACRRAMALDRRFAFVNRLPRSAALGTAVGDAMEACLTGAVSPASSELATLIDLFITLLDGLIDEVPELFEPEKERIATLLGRASPLWRNDTGTMDMEPPKHPLVDVLYRILAEGTHRLRESPVWSADPTVRETFLLAVEQAMGAEFASHGIQDIRICVEPVRRRAMLEAKSENAVYVTALISPCLNGWPMDLDQARYEEIARAIGRYLGWLDDMSDMFVDVASSRWNVALLTIHDHLDFTASGSPAHWQYTLAAALSHDRIATRLIEVGIELHEDVMRQLDAFDADCGALVHLIADATTSWLAA